MAENEISEIEQETKKKTIERSAAYPAISIEEALEFVAEVYKNFPGGQSISREDVAAVLKKREAYIHRDVAAAAHYGLLIRLKGNYQVSDLFKTYKLHLTEAEKQACLLQAFVTPKLYRDLVEKHDGHAIPAELKTHLVRFHNIAEKAAPEVAEGFIANARVVGAANENNILQYRQALEKVSASSLNGATGSSAASATPGVNEWQPVTGYTGNTGYTSAPPGYSGFSGATGYTGYSSVKEAAESVLSSIQGNASGVSSAIGTLTPALGAATPLLGEMVNEEKAKVRLSGGKFAYIIYPTTIKKVDVEILRRQLDVLELLAE
jgi:hypothetical protein